MPKRPAKPPSDAMSKRIIGELTDADGERLYRDHLLSRYLRVIARGGDVVEIAPRPGHRVTFNDEIDGDRRRVRILVGPIPPAPQKRG